MLSFRASQRDMFESVKRITGTTDVDWTISYKSVKQRWLGRLAAGGLECYSKVVS